MSIVRSLNLVCVIVERSHVFSLGAEEKDLSPAALVAEFTRSLHMVMISLIIHFYLAPLYCALMLGTALGALICGSVTKKFDKQFTFTVLA